MEWPVGMLRVASAGSTVRFVAPGRGVLVSWLPMWGGYFRTRSDDSSGKEVRNPASMALVRVDREGEQRAPCRKAILSAIVAYGVVVMATGFVRWMGAVARANWVGDGADTSISQRLVAADRVPRRTTRLFRLIVMVVALRDAVHPASHSWPMERSAPAGKCGKMCPRRAAMGKDGRSRRHVCVEVTVSPFGMATVIGSEATCLSVCGVSIER